jgi:AcrR family transcriptional regulator
MTEDEITQTKGERTRQAILDAAYDLFLEQGFAATSMRQVAERAGIALGSTYNHFSGKDDIFQALVIDKHPYVQILPLLQDVPGDTTEEFMHNAASIIQKEMSVRPDFIKLMLIEIVEFNGKHFLKLYETVFPHMLPVLQRFSPENGARDLSLPVIVRMFMGIIVAYYVTEMLMSDSSLPASIREVQLTDFIDIFMHGIMEK